MYHISNERDRNKDQEFDYFQTLSRKAVHYPETFDYLDQEFNINPQTQKKFAEIVQRIYLLVYVTFLQKEPIILGRIHIGLKI